MAERDTSGRTPTGCGKLSQGEREALFQPPESFLFCLFDCRADQRPAAQGSSVSHRVSVGGPEAFQTYILKVPVHGLAVAAVTQAHVIEFINRVADQPHRAVAEQGVEAGRMRTAKGVDGDIAAIAAGRKANLVIVAG